MVEQIPQRILFVCTGNVCRGVMAQFLLDRMARQNGWGMQARSAGIAAERYFKIPSGVRAALQGQGIASAEHIPQPVTRELLGWADLILAMERAHRDVIQERFPEFRAKVRTLKRHAGRLGPEDIEDPIGQPDAAFAACCIEIKSCLESFLCGTVPTTCP